MPRPRKHISDGRPCWCNPRVEVLCMACDADGSPCWLCNGAGWVDEEKGQPDAPRITIHNVEAPAAPR